MLGGKKPFDSIYERIQLFTIKPSVYELQSQFSVLEDQNNAFSVVLQQNPTFLSVSHDFQFKTIGFFLSRCLSLLSLLSSLSLSLDSLAGSCKMRGFCTYI